VAVRILLAHRGEKSFDQFPLRLASATMLDCYFTNVSPCGTAHRKT
jgi:hypothetical protein